MEEILEVNEQEQQPEQQDPPSKAKILFDALSQKYDLGTFPEFEGKIKDPSKRKVLFETASKDFDLGTYQEFESKLTGTTEKKNPVQYSPAPLSGSPRWGGASYVPTPSPSLSNEELSNIPAVPSEQIVGTKEWEQKSVGKGKKYNSVEEAYIADKNHSEKRAGYLWNSILKGIGREFTSANDFMYQLEQLLGVEGNFAGKGATKEQKLAAWREKVSPILREGLKKKIGSNVTPEQEAKYENEFIPKATASLLETIPGAIGLKGLGLGLTGFDYGLEAINNSEEGKKLPEAEKTMYSGLVGLTAYYLNKFQFDKIFGKQSKSAAIGITNKIITDFAAKNAGQKMTKEAFESGLNAWRKDFGSQIAKGAGKVAKATAIGGGAEFLEEGVNIGTEQLMNKIKGKEIFDPVSLGDVVGRMGQAAAIGAFGGGTLGVASVPFQKTRNYIAERVAESQSEQDINKIREEIDAAEGYFLTRTEINKLNELLDEYVAVNSKVPQDTPYRKQVIQELRERDKLKKEAVKKQQEAAQVDEAFSFPIQAEADLLNEKAEEINKKVSEGQFLEQGDNVVGSGVGGDVKVGSVDSGNKEFDDWVKDSYVVDDNGKPLLVYHGTQRKFKEFEIPSYFGKVKYATEGGAEMAMGGKTAIFFSSNKDAAATYAKLNKKSKTSILKPAFLSIKNPYIIDAKGKSWRGRIADEYKVGLRNPNYDGVIVKNVIDAASEDKHLGTVYAVKNPSQIKIAGEDISLSEAEAATEPTQEVKDKVGSGVGERMAKAEKDYNKENNIDESSPIYYHGTTKEKADNIKKVGFYKEHNVNITTDLSEAKEYAKTNTDDNGGEPAIIKVRLKNGAKPKAEEGLDFMAYDAKDVALDYSEVKQFIPTQEVKDKVGSGVGVIESVDSPEVQRQMQPITDRMAEVEMDFQNEGYEITPDYDNQIIVTKNGEIVEPSQLPDHLLKLAGDYENATSKLGEFNERDFKESLDQSRKRIYGEEAEAVVKEQSLVSAVKEAIEKYEDGSYTEGDLADVLETLDVLELKEIIDNFREEEEYNRSLKGRGDMDTAREEFIAAIEDYIAKSEKNSTLVKDEIFPTEGTTNPEAERSVIETQRPLSPESQQAIDNNKRPPAQKEKKLTERLSNVDIEAIFDPYDRVLHYFANKGKIHPSVIQKIFGSRTGKSTEGEKRSRIGILGKNAPTIDGLAHRIWEEMGSPDFIDTMEIRDAVEQVIISHNSWSSAARELVAKNDHEALYEKYMETTEGREAVDIAERLSDEEINHILDLDANNEKASELDDYLNSLTEKKETTPKKQLPKKEVSKQSAKDKLKSIADNIRKGKIGDDIAMAGVPFAKEVWNGAVEVVAKAVEVTGDITAAVQKGVEYLKQSDWYKSLANEDKVKAINRLTKYFDESVGDGEVPPPSPKSTEPKSPSDRNKAFLNRLVKSDNLPEHIKETLRKEGLKYTPRNREDAQRYANAILDVHGIEEAVLQAKAHAFEGDVNTLVQTAAIDRLYSLEKNAASKEEGLQFANQAAEIIVSLDEWLRKQGRAISAVDHFYKKSPLGMLLAENKRKAQEFEQWSKKKDQSWQEFYDELMKEPEFADLIKAEVKGELKKERASQRAGRKEKVHKAIDDFMAKAAKLFGSKGGDIKKSGVGADEVFRTAGAIMKKAYDAGEAVAKVVQDAIDYISGKIGDGWDKEGFRKNSEAMFAEGKKSPLEVYKDRLRKQILDLEEQISANKKKSRTGKDKVELDDEARELLEKRDAIKAEYKKKFSIEEAHQRLLDKFRTKLKGLTEAEKDEVIRQSYKKIIDAGGLDYEDFRSIIARVTGRSELSPEQAEKLKKLVEKVNAVEAAIQEVTKNRTRESLINLTKAELQASVAQRELDATVNQRPEIMHRLTSIMQLNTLGATSLISNITYNAWFHGMIRFPTGVVQSILERGIQVAHKISGKDYKPEVDVFSRSGQAEFFSKMGLGTKESLRQFITGLNRMDYIQKETYGQQLRPIESMKELWEWGHGQRKLSKKEATDKFIQALPNAWFAEAVARALNIGDKPMRFSAEGAQQATFAKALGLSRNTIDYDIFMRLPREEAYRIYKEQGLSDSEAATKADYIKHQIVKQGERAAMQNDNWVNDKLVQLFGGKHSGVGAFAKSLTFSPFIKIPTNAWWNYYNTIHPEIAMLQSIIYGGKAIGNKGKGDMSAMNNLRLSKYWLAHAAVGVGLRYGVMALVQNGIFIPSNTQDETKKEREGEQNFEKQGSVNVDKLWAFMRGDDPSKIKDGYTIDGKWFGLLFLMGNSIAKQEQELTPEQRKERKKIWDYAFGGLELKSLEEFQQGVFSNASGLAQAVDRGGFYADRYGVGIIGLMTNILHPAMFAQKSRAELPYVSQTKADTFIKQVENTMLQRSSAFRWLMKKNPPQKIGIWGDPIEKKDDFLMRYFGVSKTNKDAFAFPIYEDYVKTGNTEYFPSAIKPEVSDNGKVTKLNQGQYDELLKSVGKVRKDYVGAFINGDGSLFDKRYSQLSESQKPKFLSYLYEVCRQKGTEMFLEKHPEMRGTPKSEWDKTDEEMELEELKQQAKDAIGE